MGESIITDGIFLEGRVEEIENPSDLIDVILMPGNTLVIRAPELPEVALVKLRSQFKERFPMCDLWVIMGNMEVIGVIRAVNDDYISQEEARKELERGPSGE